MGTALQQTFCWELKSVTRNCCDETGHRSHGQAHLQAVCCERVDRANVGTVNHGANGRRSNLLLLRVASASCHVTPPAPARYASSEAMYLCRKWSAIIVLHSTILSYAS